MGFPKQLTDSGTQACRSSREDGSGMPQIKFVAGRDSLSPAQFGVFSVTPELS